jgi:hypothetical protein
LIARYVAVCGLLLAAANTAECQLTPLFTQCAETQAPNLIRTPDEVQRGPVVLHRMPGEPPITPRITIRRDSTSGIPVIMGALIGAFAAGTVSRQTGFVDSGDDQPVAAAMVYGLGTGLGAALGAPLGGRQSRFLETIGSALVASVPLAFALASEYEPSVGDPIILIPAAVLPPVTAWFVNRARQPRD